MLKKLQIQESWSAAVASKNIAQTVNLLLAGVLLLLALKVMVQKPVTIVVPPNFTQEFTMQGDEATEGYKALWANFVATTVGNTNPRNMDFNRDIISGMLSPHLQEAITSKMIRTSESMLTRKMTQTFTVQDAVYDPKNDITFVWGKKSVSVAKKEPLVTNWTFEIQIQSSQGMPRITYLKQYRGTPRASDLKSKQIKETPEYFSPEISDALKENKPITTGEKGLGHAPDIAPQQNAEEKGE
jgi:type IV conjugative transfer system protein TraE